MTKREALRWIRMKVAEEMRVRVSEVPDYVGQAPDPEKVQQLWQGAVWDIADRLWPEDRVNGELQPTKEG